MRRRAFCLLVIAACGVSAQAYVRSVTAAGTPLFRRDSRNIPFLVNTSVHAGATNADGYTTITADSAPLSAITAAESVWASVPTAAVGFLPLTPTDTGNDPNDGRHVITIEDSPEIRSVAGDYLAVTVYAYASDGTITDTDILLNPVNTGPGSIPLALSTTQKTGTFDLRSLIAHEMGHALGARHSGLVSATMYQSLAPFSPHTTAPEASREGTLSADDIAFLTTAYPAPGAPGQLGTIRGSVAFQSGGPILGGLVVALDPSTGIAVGGLTSLANGSYTISSLPPGRYLVYAQPLDGPVYPANLAIPDNLATTTFRTTFAGGNAAPGLTEVVAGESGTANILVDPAPPALGIDYVGTAPVNGRPGFGEFKAVAAGSALDILLWGQGLDASVTLDQIRVFGPGITFRPGSLKLDFNANINGEVPIRFTVDVASRGAQAVTSIAVTRGSDAVVRSGGLVLLPDRTGPVIFAGGVTNGASFQGETVAPGEIFTIFGKDFGPSQLATAGLNPAGRFATWVGDTRVYFDDVPAPLIYSVAGAVSGVVPYSVAGRASTLVRVEYGGLSSASVGVTVADTSPGIFTLDASGKGPGAILNWNALTRTLTVNTAANPAARGSAIALYATGEGLTEPAGVDGLLATTPLYPVPLQKNVSVTIGGLDTQVLYAGGAPGYLAGLLQVNAVIPTGVTPGPAVPITLTIGGARSAAGVTLAVR